MLTRIQNLFAYQPSDRGTLHKSKVKIEYKNYCISLRFLSPATTSQLYPVKPDQVSSVPGAGNQFGVINLI